MKTITTIFESILRDGNDLVWSPEDVDANPTGVCSVWGWGG